MTAAVQTLNASERRQRNVAVLMLLVVLAVVLVMLQQLWWAPWSEARTQNQQLAERQARAQALIAQRGPIESALVRAEAAARQQPLWLPQGSIAQAVDGIAMQVDQAVALVGGEGQRCKVQSRNPAPVAPGQSNAGQATLSLRVRCGNAELLQLLYLLETTQPTLLIDELNISAPPQYPGAIMTGAAGVLDVGFNATGFVQPAPVSGESP